MIRPLCLILLAGLAAPALAQSINPALEGDGSQTQTLDVLGGAVSVSVESEGALSLGRGDPEAEAAATLSVNDLSVGIGNRGAQNDDAAPAGGNAPGAPSVAEGQAVSGSGTDQAEACDFAMPDAAAIGEAIDAGMPVIIRHSDCAGSDPAIGRLIDNLPALAEVLDHAGTVPDRVVAITIADEGVIVYQAEQV